MPLITFECPYCGLNKKKLIEFQTGREIDNCNAEEGGCDGDFVVGYKATITTTIFKIEGEEYIAKKNILIRNSEK